MGEVLTRNGDGTPVVLSETDLLKDLEAGTEDAADRGKIPVLTNEELQYLFDVFRSPYKFVSVEPGREVVLSYDAGTLKIRRVWVNV